MLLLFVELRAPVMFGTSGWPPIEVKNDRFAMPEFVPEDSRKINFSSCGGEKTAAILTLKSSFVDPELISLSFEAFGQLAFFGI